MSPTPVRTARPRPRNAPAWWGPDAPRPPAPTARDAQWAVLLGGREALARSGWGRRTRAWQAAAPEVQQRFAFDKYWTSVLKRIGRLDDIDPRILSELDRLGATLKMLRWLAGPGDGCLPERVARYERLAAYLREVAAGRRPAGGFPAVAAAEPKVGVGARPTRSRKRAQRSASGDRLLVEVETLREELRETRKKERRRRVALARIMAAAVED